MYYDFGGSTGVQEINVTGGPVTIDSFDASRSVIYGQDSSGTSATPIGLTYSMTDNTGATSFPVMYAIEKTSPLPIKLLDFNTSRAGNNTVDLEWATAYEKSNKGFDIERSDDGSTWTK